MVLGQETLDAFGNVPEAQQQESVPAPEESNGNQFGLECENLNVKKRKDGSFCGLLVKEKYANRFVEGPESQRKIMEIRSRQFNFLKEGDRILLVSTGPSRPRHILAVLQFEFTVKITDEAFERYFPCHRVSLSELEEYKRSLNRYPGHVFGIQFRLVHIFHDPPVWKSISGEIWIYISSDSVSMSSSMERLGSACSCTLDDEEPRGQSSPTFSQKRTISLVSDTPPPTAKRTRNEGTIADMDQDDGLCEDMGEDEGDQNVHKANDDNITCCLLQPFEWAALSKGLACEILRPFETLETKLVIVERTESGHSVVGEVIVGHCCQAEGEQWLGNVKWLTTYTADRLENMKKNKTVWVWSFKDVAVYSEPFLARFLDIAPRFRNRTFNISRSQLELVEVEFPRARNFFESARFLVGQLSPDFRKVLLDRVVALAKRNSCIRIGTTCSGTDVCIPALLGVINFVNTLQAGFINSNLRNTF